MHSFGPMEVFKFGAYIPFISPALRFIADLICAVFLLFTLLSAASLIGCVRQTSVSSRKRLRHRSRHRSSEQPPPKVEQSIRVSMHCTADTNMSEHKTPTTVVGGVTRRTAMSMFGNKSRDKFTARSIEPTPVIVTVDTSQKAERPTVAELTRDKTNDGGINETHKTKSKHITLDKQDNSNEQKLKTALTAAVTCLPASVAQQAHQSILDAPAVLSVSPTPATSDGAMSKSHGRQEKPKSAEKTSIAR